MSERGRTRGYSKIGDEPMMTGDVMVVWMDGE